MMINERFEDVNDSATVESGKVSVSLSDTKPRSTSDDTSTDPRATNHQRQIHAFCGVCVWRIDWLSSYIGNSPSPSLTGSDILPVAVALTLCRCP